MGDTRTFGFELRQERERRGISLEAIAARTNVSVSLWAAMESNDFSRWPTGVFARSNIRAYATLVGIDPDETIDEFCRQFPAVGDRRAGSLIRSQANLIGHRSEYRDDLHAAPHVDRRRPAADASGLEGGRAGMRLLLSKPAGHRAVAAAMDAGVLVLCASTAVLVVGSGFWASFGVCSLFYYSGTLVLAGGTPGALAVAHLRHKLSPTLAVSGRRAHA